MNGMKKAARLGKKIAITFLLIAFLSACVYIIIGEDGTHAAYIETDADDYNGIIANSNAVAILDIATSSYIQQSFNRQDNKVTSRSDSERLTENEMDPENVPSVIASIEKEIQEEIASRGKVNLDEKVEKVIDILENEGKTDVIPKYLGKDKEKQKEYLKDFIRASYSTKFPDLKSGNSELDGIVKFKRGNKYLEYKPYDEFVGLINENNSDVEKYFSLKYENEKTKLIIPNWSIDENGEKSYNLLNPIDYQTELNLFAMPFDFIWAMLVVSSDKDFAYDLANLAINESSIIEISIIDTEISYEGESETEAEANQEAQTGTEVEANTDTQTGTETEEEQTDSEAETEEVGDINDLGTELSKENVVNIALTKADTWLLEYSMVCSATIEEVEQENGEKIKNVVLNKGTPTIKEKLDKNSETENFVTLFNKKEYTRMRKNITTGSAWLYEILSKSEDTVGMIDTVKYILYKATNDERFAVSDFNWQDLAVFGLNTNASIYTYGSGFWWPIGSSKKIGEFTDDEKPPSTTYIRSYWGPRDIGYHYGIDISATGTHYIIASADGTVSKAIDGYTRDGFLENTDGGGFGNHIIIDHGNGIFTMYAHLKPNSVTVKEGEKVKQGQIIAEMGNTGRSTGQHLHFEVRDGGTDRIKYAKDPLNYVDPQKPRPKAALGSTLYDFLLKFEGGTNHIASSGDYEVFNNGADKCLELTCGLVISNDKSTGEIKSSFKSILPKDRYKIGDIVSKEEYHQCLGVAAEYVETQITNACTKYGRSNSNTG